MTTPFIAVSSEELGEDVGEKSTCPACGELHKVEYAAHKQAGKISGMTAFVSCPKGGSYLVEIDGKLIKSEKTFNRG